MKNFVYVFLVQLAIMTEVIIVVSGTSEGTSSVWNFPRPKGSINAVYDLVDRVLKTSDSRNVFHLTVTPDNNINNQINNQAWFKLEQWQMEQEYFDEDVNNRNSTTRTSKGTTKIAITATSMSELTAGVGYYLKEYCNMTIEWSTGGRAGGSHIVVPDIWPVPLHHSNSNDNDENGESAKDIVVVVQRYRTVPWSYLMNVCTHSYSLVWYDWTAWQALIDNLALRGINMILALTGQEEIQYQVYTKLGMKDEDIRSWFNGPAFLTWSRGQNEYGAGIAGPLPRSFMKSQWYLQREHILPRLRSLGIVGVLPAFQGNVPIQIKTLFNDSNITQQDATGWVDSLDPLFLHIADLWMTQLVKDFGTDHYYQLDGYFNGGTAPWFHHDNEAKRMSITAQQSSLVRRRMRRNVSNTSLTVNVLQHDDTWYRRGRAAYAGLNRTDPDAIWMYQGFAFVGWDTDEQASYVKGFVDSAPENRFVVIDMSYSPDGEWQKWNNASFFGAPFIWTKLYNFGDTMGLRGDLHQINSAFPFQAQKAMSSIVGIGATPEGIDINPLYFNFLYEQNFRSVPVGDLTNHIIRVNHKRYGLSMFDRDVAGAWKLLMKSSYSQEFSVQDQTGVAHLNPRSSSSLFHDDRMTPMPILCSIYNSWIHMVRVSEKLQHVATEPFLYDLVNVGREVLAQLATPMALNFSDAASAQRMNPTALISTGTLYIQLLLDLDHLLSTNVAFRLRPWLESSRRLAAEDEGGRFQYDCFSPILNYSNHDGDDGSCKRFYEWNARCQVTTWNPTPPNASEIPGGPIDYAAKHWSGLIRDYYAKRAAILLHQSLQDQKRGQQLNSTEVQRLFAKHAFEWTTAKRKPHLYGLELSSSLERARNISREMMQKYSHWFEAC